MPKALIFKGNHLKLILKFQTKKTQKVVIKFINLKIILNLFPR
jgi:hypothetical protein